MRKKYKYNKEADAFLTELYRSVGARTWLQRMNTLELKLGIVPGSQCYSHEPTTAQKVGMMEYDLLGFHNLINLVLV